MSTHPFDQISKLISDGRATYVNAGVTDATECYVVVWASPSGTELCRGRGATIVAAARDALDQLGEYATPTVQSMPMPGMMTR